MPGVASAFHEGCDQPEKMFSPECTAAAHRYCKAAVGHENAFGLAHEAGPDSMTVSCGIASIRRDVAFTEMAANHEGCRSPADARVPACMAAAGRFCRGQGMMGGLVQEVGPASVEVACFEHGSRRTAKFSELRQHHEGCGDAGGQNIQCVAAASRLCDRSSGDTQAGLMQEQNLQQMDLACFNAVHRADVGIAVMSGAAKLPPTWTETASRNQPQRIEALEERPRTGVVPPKSPSGASRGPASRAVVVATGIVVGRIVFGLLRPTRIDNPEVAPRADEIERGRLREMEREHREHWDREFRERPQREYDRGNYEIEIERETSRTG